MTYATLDDLRAGLGGKDVTQTAEYRAKMLHKIPDLPVIDREPFILKRCKDKRVLEFGASGPLHRAIKEVVGHEENILGVDLNPADESVVRFDLDDVRHHELPGIYMDPDVIVCGEILEHLTNPGWFLTRLKQEHPGVPVIFTVPNAFSAAGAKHMLSGNENVNKDHVCWYSYTTLTTLLTKVGFEILSSAWYKGDPLVAEGLVMVAI